MDPNFRMTSWVYRRDGSLYFVITAAFPKESIGYLSKAFPMDNGGNLLDGNGNIAVSEPDPIIAMAKYNKEDAERTHIDLCRLFQNGYIMGL